MARIVEIDAKAVPSSADWPVQSAEALPAADDDADIGPYRGIYIGVAGNLQIMHVGDTTLVTYSNLPVGLYPLAFKRLGELTTATGLLGVK